MKLLNWFSRKLGDYDLFLPAGPRYRGHQLSTSVGLILVAFALGFWLPIYNAVSFLVRGETTAGGGPWILIRALVPPVGLTIGLILIFLWPLNSERKWITPRQAGLVWPGTWRESSWPIHLGTGAAVQIATLLSFAVASSVFEVPAYPVNWEGLDEYGWASAIITFTLAGFQEEILLVGVLVYLLRRAGAGWGLIIVLSALLRISFHIYYGWGSLFLGLWAAAAVLAYVMTGRLVGIIVVHSLWDIRGLLIGIVPEAVNVLIGALFVLALFGAGLWTSKNRYKTRKRLRATSGVQRYPC